MTDPLSHFCDRCGSPLVPAEKPLPPVVPAEKVTICPTCGFKNPGEDLFYCKKCGVYIPKKKPASQRGTQEPAPARRPQDGGTRTRQQVGLDAARQRPATVPVAGGPPPAGVTVQPRKRPQKSPKKSVRSYRRIALVAAGVLILLLIIAVITGSIPGIPGAGPANATAPDSTDPGLLDGILSGMMSLRIPPTNMATPVVTDTPLLP